MFGHDEFGYCNCYIYKLVMRDHDTLWKVKVLVTMWHNVAIVIVEFRNGLWNWLLHQEAADTEWSVYSDDRWTNTERYTCM